MSLHSLTPSANEVGTFLTAMSAALASMWAVEGVPPPFLEKVILVLMAVTGVLALGVGWLVRHVRRVDGKPTQLVRRR